MSKTFEELEAVNAKIDAAVRSKNASSKITTAECEAAAARLTQRLSSLVKTEPEIVADALELRLIKDVRMDRTVFIERLPTGEVKGHLRFKYLSLEVPDPDLKNAIGEFGTRMVSRCRTIE